MTDDPLNFSLLDPDDDPGRGERMVADVMGRIRTAQRESDPRPLHARVVGLLASWPLAAASLLVVTTAGLLLSARQATPPPSTVAEAIGIPPAIAALLSGGAVLLDIGNDGPVRP